MLEEQFTMRLFLIMILGVLYGKTMKKMAMYKPLDEAKKNIVMMVIGVFFLFVGLISGVQGLHIDKIQHPTEMLEFIPTPNQIYRPSSSSIIWGFPTDSQRIVITSAINCMSSIGLWAYFFYFRKSNTKSWEKVLKFLFGLLYAVSYHNATELHYFDKWELWAIILFAIMTYYVKKKVKRSMVVSLASEVSEVILEGRDKTKEEGKRYETIREDDNSRYMLKTTEKNANQSDVLLNHIEGYTSNETIETIIHNYCCYCGKKIDYDGVKFCKHCGKPID